MEITNKDKKEFNIYMDWWITQQAWQLTSKPFNDIKLLSFNEFKDKQGVQTNRTFLNEWVWKFPESFN